MIIIFRCKIKFYFTHKHRNLKILFNPKCLKLPSDALKDLSEFKTSEKHLRGRAWIMGSPVRIPLEVRFESRCRRDSFRT